MYVGPDPFDIRTPEKTTGDATRMQVPPGCLPAGPGAVSAWVAGVPAPQGSKRPLGRQGGFGRHIMIESSTKVKPWRADVRQAFLDALAGITSATGGGEGMAAVAFPAGPVSVKIVFVLPRTKAMRNRPSGDFPMVQKPDLDKLERAVLDALKSAGVYADDSQVVGLHGFKRRAEPGEPTGAMIHVEPWRVEPGPPPADTPETVEAKMQAVRAMVGRFTSEGDVNA